MMVKIEFSQEENGFIMECEESGLKEFITVEEFNEMVVKGELEKIDDEELCDCQYCQGFRDGVETACDVAEELEAYDEECGCECDTCRAIDLDEEIENDIKDSLLALKEVMDELLEDACYCEYRELTDCYERLYKLIY